MPAPALFEMYMIVALLVAVIRDPSIFERCQRDSEPQKNIVRIKFDLMSSDAILSYEATTICESHHCQHDRDI